jgi:hypothetical protein
MKAFSARMVSIHAENVVGARSVQLRKSGKRKFQDKPSCLLPAYPTWGR